MSGEPKFAVFSILQFETKIAILIIRLKKGVAKNTSDMKQYIVGGIGNRDNSRNNLNKLLTALFLKIMEAPRGALLSVFVERRFWIC